MTYYQLREQTWPFRNLWGDFDQRRKVRDYLKKAWKKCDPAIYTVETNTENVRREAESILQWWWENCYDKTGSRSLDGYPDDFGTFLLGKYKSSLLNPDDNTGCGRF